MNNLITLSKKRLVKELWLADPKIKRILKNSKTLGKVRSLFFNYLNSLERHYFNIYSDRHFKSLHITEKNNAKECIRVLKNIIRTENEQLTGFSALKMLFDIAKNKKNGLNKVSKGFLWEFIFLFKGISGKSEIFSDVYEDLDLGISKWETAIDRSNQLDTYSTLMRNYFKKYKTGLDADVIKQRNKTKKEILRYFKADETDWENYLWHLNHVIKDIKILSSLVKVEKDEIEGLKYAKKNNIPFQITPYYLSLFNKTGISDFDSVLRAQVIPSVNYCSNFIKICRKNLNLDFMGEKYTSPIEGITRRYPQILILKPFVSCPQICVYCQRNWEIKRIDRTELSGGKINKAIEWINNNKNISEVLITGGDPLTLNNDYLASLIDRVAKIRHLERIRIGTRTLVTLPFRINEGFLKIIKKYHQYGKREICIVTHFEHPSEITPDSLKAIEKIKELGITIYNQQVFTYFNSRRFETCFLRKILKLCGIDPYYSFNTMGKEETFDFRVPIARLEQERREEARLLPGIIRTDEPVFNVPKLGKSHLIAWQDHEPIMILANGGRVYRFYPWESELTITDDYLYTDVSIHEYLRRLHKDGENINDYRSIWYYF